MGVLVEILNRVSQYIRFTREVPHEDWLPYLNTQIKISGGRCRVKWYRKNSSKNISNQAESTHPEAVKRAVVRNMYKTAPGVRTGEVEREESRKLACEIADSNGYRTQHRRKVPPTARTLRPPPVSFLSFDRQTDRRELFIYSKDYT
ncbi:hypothetical protein V3C99_018674 [Haemonchus contortus]|uniref:Helix-turn-helix domain-containing protein n=1 Tax=Haemonchus contortus TaxID=6289 RepID=A0A7I4Z2B6_HAECO